MSTRTKWVIGIVAVVAILATAAAVWKILQDDVWVDPSKGGLAPTRTSAGRATPDYSRFVADFLVEPEPGTRCADGSRDTRCDYMLCRVEGRFMRSELESITYTVAPAPAAYPRYEVSMVSVQVAGDAYVDVAITEIAEDDTRTELDLVCCEHDPSNPTCKDGPGPACGGSGLPLEMYYPHVPGTTISIKPAGKNREEYAVPEDIPKSHGLKLGDTCNWLSNHRLP